jgi:hypothetical protein
MKCASCGKTLASVFDDDANENDFQQSDALWIGFFGGYGMFIEEPDHDRKATDHINDASYEAVICHDCAHKLCNENQWIAGMLHPERSHAHAVQYWTDHPDHDGWDKPFIGRLPAHGLIAIDGSDLARSIISNGHARRKDTVIIDGRSAVAASEAFIGTLIDILVIHHIVHIDLVHADETIIDLFKNAVRLYPDMNVNAWE